MEILKIEKDRFGFLLNARNLENYNNDVRPIYVRVSVHEDFSEKFRFLESYNCFDGSYFVTANNLTKTEMELVISTLKEKHQKHIDKLVKMYIPTNDWK